MEQFLLENVQRYQGLVKRFVPPRTKNNAAPEPQSATSDLLVATRIRPMLEDELSSGQVPAVFTRPMDERTVDLHDLKRVVRGLPTLNSSCFRPGNVYGADRTTDAIYNDMVQPLLPWAWDGNVGTLFAYGQTGSGKTFSISRLERLVAKSLFDGSLPGERRIYVSIFELAGSSARDLLSSLQTGPAPVQLLEDSFGDIQLSGAFEPEVTFTGELLQLIEQAAAFRKTASTEKNSGSSRSHAVCRIRISNPSQDVLEDGYLYLIDLAGSEAARDITDHSADRMKETREINISLSILKDCIRSIAGLDSSKSSKKPYVPFRQSTLTKTLKHVFDPSGDRKCKTAVLACVNPSFLDTGATKNTLRYAEMLLTAQPTNKPSGYNPNIPTTWTNKDVRNYIVTKSGNPSIAPYELAPKETGAQLLRLPIEKFIERSMKTIGVTEEQARAFHLKLWTLHLDSQRKKSTKANGQQDPGLASSDPLSSNLSSRDLSGKPDITFTERIRPGMAVRWNPPTDFPFRHEAQNLAVVLCPLGAANGSSIDVMGRQIQQPVDGNPAFLCAVVLPGALGDSFEIHLWRQIAVPVHDMLSEVILEYDAATRYYHITV